MRRSGLLLVLTALLIGQVALYGQPVPKNSNIVVANEGQINSKLLEFSPAFYQDGLVFITSNSPGVKYNVLDARIGKNIMSIYYSDRDTSGFLQKPTLFAEDLITVYHEGPLTFNRTGETMYFTRNNLDNKGRKLERSKEDGVAKLAIFKTERTGEVWGKAMELSFNDPESNFAHPSIGVDENVLYFTSDRDGGFGGMDIWMVRMVGDDWGDPINLGERINTPGNEIFPYIHADGTLYFASDGHEGLGGLDMFYTKNIGNEWQPPINLKKPFNSPQDDFGLIVDRDKKNGYFSSNRPGGTGDDDIYNFFASGGGLEADEYTRDILLIVTDKETGDRLDEVKITPLNLDKLAMSNAIVDQNGNIIRLLPEEEEGKIIVKLDVEEGIAEGFTDVNGEYKIKELPYENYVVKLRKSGYVTNEIVLSDDEEETVFYAALVKAEEKVKFAGTIRNESGAPLAGATVTVVDLETGEEQTVTTDNEGKFTHYLDYEKDYAVKSEKGNFVSDVKTVSTKGMDRSSPQFIDYDVEMVSTGDAPFLAAGTVIELPSIYYNFNDANIRPDARKDLDALGSIMKTFPSMKIELLSHTDSRGSENYNQLLSQRRAQNAVNFLLERGIAKDRMIPIGYGETQPRVECPNNSDCTEAQHQLNRRTEFRVANIDADVTVKYLDNEPEVIDLARGGQIPNDAAKGAEPVVVDEVPKTTDDSKTPKPEDQGTQPLQPTQFMVISGTFSKGNYAKSQLDKVKSLGYSDAYLITYRTNNYKAVVVGTFSNKENAQQLESEIETQHNISSYVRELNKNEIF